jgi:hypothetical protein
MTCYASLALIREGFPHSEELLQLIRGGKQLANIASDALGYRLSQSSFCRAHR